MKSLFKSKPRSPIELAQQLRELLIFVDPNSDPRDKKRHEKLEELNKRIWEIKNLLYGAVDGSEPNPEACAQFTQEFFQDDTFRLLITSLPKLDSGFQQDAIHVLTNLQRQRVKSKIIASEYMEKNMDIMDILVPGYEDTDIALTYGPISRGCIRHQSVAKYVLESHHLMKFFDYVQSPSFEAASDAAATFKELLTRHKSTVAEFLSKNYDWFFKEYNSKLLQSESYITRRHSVQLLGDILLDRSNSAVMLRYVSSLDNMKILMNLLRETNKAIQLATFNVFKLFIANQNKPSDINDVLVSNKSKLLRFFQDFDVCTKGKDKDKDKDKNNVNEQFEADKAQVVLEISSLKAIDLPLKALEKLPSS